VKKGSNNTTLIAGASFQGASPHPPIVTPTKACPHESGDGGLLLNLINDYGFQSPSLLWQGHTTAFVGKGFLGKAPLLPQGKLKGKREAIILELTLIPLTFNAFNLIL